jgi:SAM-dependent methyltransferase
MARYALLTAPSANRVYTQAAPQLVAAELAVFSARALDGRISEPSTTTWGRLPYLTFETDGELSVDDLRLLANLSSGYALYQVTDGELLRPLGEPGLDRYDDDLISIQKYAGKTNEHFTRLLLNVTALASAWGGTFMTRRFTVLDPVAGRGTTLNQALMYGWDALGIEIDSKEVEAYGAFIKTWLKRKRLKHEADITPLRRENRRLGKRLDVTMAASKEAHREGDVQRLSFFDADTTLSRQLMKAQVADLIVADLPYGVVHGSRSAGKLERGPLELLVEALPSWAELLRPGGAIGLSWNTHVASRDDLAELLAQEGLKVLDGFDGFEHWVDQSITRDVLVARKG